MDSMYLDNLDEFINDEKRIVTYRWLSLTLNVSSNVAKQMLYHYYDVNQKKQNSDEEHRLSVTYLLSGILYDDELKQDIHKICVVQDEELDKMKQSFKQIYSIHIYSIQKTKLKDLHILYGIDHDKIKENVFRSAEFSSIVFPTSKFKSDATSKYQVNDVESIKKSSPQKPLHAKKETESVDQNKENKKNEKNTQLGSKKEAKGSLASMFANQTKKQEAKKPLEVKQESNSKTKDSSNAALKKGSLFSFLTKDKPVKKEEKVTSPVKVKKEEEEKTPMKIELDSDSGVEDEDVVKTQNTPSQLKISPKKSTSKLKTPSINSQKSKRKVNSTSKGKRKSSNNSNIKSKRQRIMTLDDTSSSESSNEEEELMDECPIPSPPRLIESDDEDIIPATPKESSESESLLNKRRKRKLVDKTFEDDQGFLVTKKEYEYVLVSDDDENPIPTSQVKTSPHITTASPIPTKTSPRMSGNSTKTSPKKSPKKKSPPVKASKKSPVKSKQASIMSFFKMKN